FRGIDSSKATTNLWGERWSKLVQNSMGNGVTAATGLTSGDCLRNPRIRRFQIRLAGEAVRVGQALGYTLERIRGADPERLARAVTFASGRDMRLTRTELGVSARLAIEALGLRPTQALRFYASNTHPRLGVIVTNHFYGSLDT